MRNRFDEQLARMNRELIQMGALCEEAISLASRALAEGSREYAEKVSAIAAETDRMERDIESLCLKLLLQQQPVARDLRQISAALKIITDMERIGDQAEDIAEIVLILIAEGHAPERLEHIHEMTRSAVEMVTDSVDAYVSRDTALAASVIAGDDLLDDYFKRVRRSLIKRIAREPSEGEYALDLMMIDKYLERIGDHAVNIAQWVIFSVTGEKDLAPACEEKRDVVQ
nr:phosphate signaling complex protein PhoU [Acutalibacter sp. M00204]